MDLKVYNGGTILAPLKCGTRFLDESFGVNDEGYTLHLLRRGLFYPKFKTMVVRPPMEHISSALHTEIINAYNNTDTNPDEPVDISVIIDTFIWKGPEQTHQNIHWHRDLYSTLYWIWRRNRNNIEIVELKDLSSHLKSIGIKITKHKKENYNFSNFKNYCDVDELMMFIKLNYVDEWRNMMKQVEVATEYYNYLINREVIPIKFV